MLAHGPWLGTPSNRPDYGVGRETLGANAEKVIRVQMNDHSAKGISTGTTLCSYGADKDALHPPLVHGIWLY